MKPLKAFLWMLVIIPAFIFNSCEKLFEAEQEGILELGVMVDEQTDSNLLSMIVLTWQANMLL